MKNVAIVTGANRGLGFAAAKALLEKGWHVVFAARNTSQIDEAALSGSFELAQLDVCEPKQIAALKAKISSDWGKLDALINNAGILNEAESPLERQSSSLFVSDIDRVRETIEVNTIGALRMIQAFVDLLKAAPVGRIVNISSGMGQMSEMGGAFPGYRVSKAGMNVLTLVGAEELTGTNVKINSLCPGWVRTDMGGPDAVRSIEEATEGIVWAATLDENGPTGGFFRDGQVLQW